MRFGVPQQTMGVSGCGKNDRRVATADGVRESQNRRVEIGSVSPAIWRGLAAALNRSGRVASHN
jgi:hypothetical protein